VFGSWTFHKDLVDIESDEEPVSVKMFKNPLVRWDLFPNF
jgi:hypothetical protein